MQPRTIGQVNPPLADMLAIAAPVRSRHRMGLAKPPQIGVERRGQAGQKTLAGSTTSTTSADRPWDIVVAAQDLARRLDARDAAAGDHDVRPLALLHQRALPLLDRQCVGNAATTQRVALDARNALGVPKRACRDHAGVEAQFVAAGGQQLSPDRTKFGHPVLQEPVPGLFDARCDDGRPIQP
jgi:hypothetical protein